MNNESRRKADLSRRNFVTRSALAAAAGTLLTPNAFASGTRADQSPSAPTSSATALKTLAFVVFPGITPLDMIGPATAMAHLGMKVEYVWRDLKPVRTELAHISFQPTLTFEQAKNVDILCVPGTGDPYALLNQTEMFDWMNRVGAQASWVTSVCTGSILLGAAGLLNGYRATSHWSMLDDLAKFGATPLKERVVVDRNRMTGGGVTAGIDFGLQMVARIAGDEQAKLTELLLQYAPQPPFNSGTPALAGERLTASTRDLIFSNVQTRTPDYLTRLSESAARAAKYPS